MINNNNVSNIPNDQFVLSYEMLCLLHWLVEHDADNLKQIIAKALSAGLKNKLHKLNTSSSGNLVMIDDIQQSIVDFFALLEALLLESINERVTQKAREENLIPAIDQIDSTLCDTATVRSSLEQATNTIEHNPDMNAKEQLFKELLKQWKPRNKTMVN